MNTPHTEFFETIEPAIKDLARRLGIDPDWILGVSAFESGWCEDHESTDNNNPFGIRTTIVGSKDRNKNVERHFESVGAAVAEWERLYGNRVRGAKSAEEFVGRLQDTSRGQNAYNSEKHIDWSGGVLGTIDGVKVRQDIRASGGAR